MKIEGSLYLSRVADGTTVDKVDKLLGVGLRELSELRDVSTLTAVEFESAGKSPDFKLIMMSTQEYKYTHNTMHSMVSAMHTICAI